MALLRIAARFAALTWVVSCVAAADGRSAPADACLGDWEFAWRRAYFPRFTVVTCAKERIDESSDIWGAIASLRAEIRRAPVRDP